MLPLHRQLLPLQALRQLLRLLLPLQRSHVKGGRNKRDTPGAPPGNRACWGIMKNDEVHIFPRLRSQALATAYNSGRLLHSLQFRASP